MIGVCGSLAAFGSGHQHEGMTVGVSAVLVMVAGLVWLAVEHRRVRRIFNEWYLEHPDVIRQRPAS